VNRRDLGRKLGKIERWYTENERNVTYINRVKGSRIGNQTKFKVSSFNREDQGPRGILGFKSNVYHCICTFRYGTCSWRTHPGKNSRRCKLGTSKGPRGHMVRMSRSPRGCVAGISCTVGASRGGIGSAARKDYMLSDLVSR